MANAPTFLGRIVHFYDEAGNGPSAAIVTHVLVGPRIEDGLVNLTVFGRWGEQHPKGVGFEKDVNGNGSWRWPPRE